MEKVLFKMYLLLRSGKGRRVSSAWRELCLCGWRFRAKPIFFCNIFFYNSDSCRRYFLKCICCCVQGKVGELVQPGGSKWGLPWGLLCGTSMIPCHSCHIYGIWRSKGIGRRFKVIIWDGNKSHKERTF